MKSHKKRFKKERKEDAQVPNNKVFLFNLTCEKVLVFSVYAPVCVASLPSSAERKFTFVPSVPPDVTKYFCPLKRDPRKRMWQKSFTETEWRDVWRRGSSRSCPGHYPRPPAPCCPFTFSRVYSQTWDTEPRVYHWWNDQTKQNTELVTISMTPWLVYLILIQTYPSIYLQHFCLRS